MFANYIDCNNDPCYSSVVILAHAMKKTDLNSQAVMNVGKDETIAGMWATPEIPQVGIYKLAAKKRADGIYEWVHFQHRPDDTRKVLFRGEVESLERLADVLEAANKQLQNIFGVSLSIADVSMKTVDGRGAGSRVH